MDTDPQDSVLNVSDATATVHENENSELSGEGLTSNSSKANISGHQEEVAMNLTNSSYIYRDDVVKLNDGNKIGIVTEVAGELDSESEITDDEDDDDEDDEDEDEDEEGEEEEEEEEEGEEEKVVDGDREEGNEEEGKEEDGEEEEGEKERGDAENKGGENIRTSDADENRNNGSLLADQVRVLWLDDSESSHHINELALVDRGFLHGDYVASASNPTGQVGLVVDVNIYVDLLTPDGSIIKDVCTRDLKRVRDITIGDFVIFGPWLGRVDDVLDNVTVLFDDGSVCKVIRADPVRLIPTDKISIEDGHCPYHPGQRVKASSSTIFKSSLWSKGSWKANKREGTVTKVAVGSVYVHWIASAGYGPESSSTPAEEQSPKNLKLLSCFTHANWQLGDWCLLPSSAPSSSIPLDKGSSKLELQEDFGSAHAGSVSDEVTTEESTRTSEPIDLGSNDGTGHCNVSSKSGSSSLSVSKGSMHETWPIHRKKLRKVVIKREKKIRKKEETFEKALQIVNTKTRASVAWQDGIIEHQLEASSLIPVESPGDHDFVAEQYVVERGNDDTEDVSEIRRVGVVKSVNAKEKTACIKWLKPLARPEDLKEFDKEEIVSVYELEGHPDYDYCYGDVVVRLSPVSIPVEANFLFEFGEERQQESGSNVLEHDIEKESSLHEVDNAVAVEEASTEFSDLSWVGNITGLKDGDIEVTWADGMVSTVGPQAIYVVGRDDDDASVAGGSEISDAASWETVDDDEMDAQGNVQKEPASASDTDINIGMEEIIVDGENNPGRNGPLSIPFAAIGFVTRLASGIFSRGRKDEDSLTTDAAAEDEELPLRDMSKPAEGPYCRSSSQDGSSNDVQVIHDKSDEFGGEESTNSSNEKQSDPPTDAGSIALVSPSTDDFGFKHFDTAKDPLDHFFLDVDASRNSSRKWLKKVQQDWNILQNNLPDSIYVRVYEDRMDLLRAVIIGAYGTPYQDGLFFFDFHLPADYPDVPPSAHYHSGGWRINPNLYEEGKVCLSLLNTWTGRGNEVWDPKCSSILQVLVSLQGLVLNSKPYFNEAGYDKQVGTAEGEKNSLSYNENTFLLNCKTIMYLVRKPPKDFDAFVKDHFKRRGCYILKACDAYMKGYLIGTLTEDASVNEKSEPNATSVGFKLMLAKLMPKLYTALSGIGSDCSEFNHLQQS